jgi:hypothetical protein
MINSIGSSGSMPPPPPRSSQPLTEDQQQLLTDTLSEYDTENLTSSDAQSIIETLSDAGIQPGKELESAMAELGFDAKNIGELAGGEHRPPPPPEQSSEEISSISNFLTEMVAAKLAETGQSELSSADKEDIFSKLYEKFGIDDGESVINTTA